MKATDKEKLIAETIAFVKSELENAEGGHDWFHIERVYKNAVTIAREEHKANTLIVELGALLHDIADYKFTDGDESLGPEKARAFLAAQNKLTERSIESVVNIVRNTSFKGGNFNREYNSLELNIVQDADRLDALGAIGIARTFHYGGYKNRKIYTPDSAPSLNMTPEEYKKSEAPTIDHFYEKLLLLKDRMHTYAGKRIAAERHRFMELFLEQFYAEWEGRR